MARFPTSGSDAAYTFTQGTPSASWVVVHGLGKHPSVSVTDSAGDQVEGDVIYNSTSQLTINFTAPFAGFAYLN